MQDSFRNTYHTNIVLTVARVTTLYLTAHCGVDEDDLIVISGVASKQSEQDDQQTDHCMKKINTL
jgi:hypothetical protein